MNNYKETCKLYLSIVIYKKYLNNDFILIDLYKEAIDKIYIDYLKYDNKNKSLLDSIENYIETQKDFVFNLINDCIE